MDANRDFASYFQDPQYFINPHPIYRAYRQQNPVSWSNVLNGWVVVRYHDIVRLFKTKAIGREGTDFVESLGVDVGRVYGKWMQWYEGKAHSRLRQPVEPPFTKAGIADLSDRFRSLLQQSFSSCENLAEFDYLERVAYPLPVYVICDILGLGTADYDRFVDWSGKIAGTLNPAPNEESRAQNDRIVREVESYLKIIIEEKRRTGPHADLIWAMLETQKDAVDGLTDEEVVALSLLMFFAGHETTSHSLSLGLGELLRHDSQWQMVKSDPSRYLKGAVEEMFRMSSTVPMLEYKAMKEIQLGDQTIKPGQSVWPIMVSANYDDEVFKDPERFDLLRKPNPHVAFGLGSHICLGRHLGRLEVTIALEETINAMPDLELVSDQLKYRPTIGMRGISELRVRNKSVSKRLRRPASPQPAL